MALTFGQANGHEPLPAQAQLGAISQETVAALWNVIHEWLSSEMVHGSMGSRGKRVLQTWWVAAKHQMIDAAPYDRARWQQHLKAEICGGLVPAYNLVQFLLENGYVSASAKSALARALEKTRAAYRVIENRVVPFSSQAEHDSLVTAIETAAELGASGARSHLLNAGGQLTAGQWGGAIHESISAVESAAKLVSGEHSKDLSAILTKMQKEGSIRHPALAGALKQLYGYTSDEKGVRHSLVLEDAAQVTESDAFLMFGLCASFVTYLLRPPVQA